MVSRKEWYTRVNTTWPKEVPPLTGEEATRAVRKLWRKFRKVKCMLPIVVTSGNRYTWVYNGQVRVNAEAGWKALVHNLSHYFHRRRQTGVEEDARVGPHHKTHARLELRMIREVVKRGWLRGKLRSVPKPPTATLDPGHEKLKRLDARIVRWESRLKRSQNALRKLIRSRKALCRRLEKQAVLPQFDIAAHLELEQLP